MKRIALLIALLIPTISFAQATRDVQKKASRQTANVETITADKTLTYLDAETQLLTPSGADRTVNLPSSNVWKAWTVKIVNEDAANKLVIKSSDGTTLDTLAAVGRVEFVARQATPTGSAHWTNLSKIGTLGVTDGSSACVGCVGESISAPIAGTATNTSATAVGSMSVPAGSWLLIGTVIYYGTGGANDYYDATFGTTANALAGYTMGVDRLVGVVHKTSGAGSSCTFYKTVNLSSSQTYYMNVQTNLAGSGTNGMVGNIQRIRIR